MSCHWLFYIHKTSLVAADQSPKCLYLSVYIFSDQSLKLLVINHLNDSVYIVSDQSLRYKCLYL